MVHEEQIHKLCLFFLFFFTPFDAGCGICHFIHMFIMGNIRSKLREVCFTKNSLEFSFSVIVLFSVTLGR